MKLVHPNIKKQLIFNENRFINIIIENQDYLIELIQELIIQCSGGEGRFVLSEDLNIIDISKNMFIITDLFNIDINQKKIINKLYNILKEQAYSSDYYVETNSLLSNLYAYSEKIISDINYPIKYNNDIDISSLFKILEIKIDTEYTTLLERVLDYVSVLHEICKINIFIFTNLKSFLKEEDIIKLYKELSYKKIYCILIENVQRDKIEEFENVLIIDKDLCEIY